MKRQLFTQEGKEYVIKSISNNFTITYPAAHLVEKKVYINNEAVAAKESVHFVTNKRIIPVSYSLSAIQLGGLGIYDVSNCYSSIRSGPGFTILPSYRVYLGKLY